MIRDFAQFSKETLFAIAAGLSLVFAAEPFSIPGLAFAFPVLFSLSLSGGEGADEERVRNPHRQRSRPRAFAKLPSPHRGFAIGLCTGLTIQLGAFAWIPELLVRFGGFPTPLAWLVASLLYLAQSLPWALAAMFAVSFERAGVRRLFAHGLSLLIFAYSLPTLFPWRPADVLTSSALPFAQLAELGGATLVDAAFTLVGLNFLEIPRSRLAPALFFAAVALPTAFGLARISSLESDVAPLPSEASTDETRRVPIAVLQPNISIEDKHNPELAFRNLERLHGMSLSAEERGAELILWPESAYPFPIHRERKRDHPGEYALRPRGLRAPIIAGALTQRGGCERWNSVLAVGPDGRILGVTDKIVLLTFGEFAPFHSLYPAWLKEKVPCPGFLRGEREPTLDVEGVRYGVLNCYEDLLAYRARAVSNAGAEILLNFTNDAWFGDTAEPHLHHMVSRLRTIETRRELIRAVNTGVSAHVSKTGRDLLRTETFTEAIVLASAAPSQQTTLFLLLGDWLRPILAGGMLALGWIALGRTRTLRRLGLS